MATKRFNYIMFDGFEDNGEYITHHDVANLLNEFYEENERLKSEYKVLHTQYHDLKKFVENNFDEYLTQEKLNRQIIKLSDENEQLKEQLSEAKTDEKQLGISFMGYKMKLIEVLQKKYDKVKGKTLYADVYTEIAEEMGVDLE